MSKEYTIATFNCENLFTRPSIFEEPDEKAKELLHEVDLLKADLKKPVFDHDEIKRLTKSLEKYATINDIRGKATSAKGAAEWVGYVSLVKTALKDEAVNNVARVIADLDADIISMIEVEDRITLKGFHDDILFSEFLKPAVEPLDLPVQPVCDPFLPLIKTEYEIAGAFRRIGTCVWS